MEKFILYNIKQDIKQGGLPNKELNRKKNRFENNFS